MSNQYALGLPLHGKAEPPEDAPAVQLKDLQVECSNLRSLVDRLTFALAAERAYNANNTGENSARRKTAWAGLTLQEQAQVKRMQQRHGET
jgi:hypothetical protein